jgi:hypothetical protein
MDHSAYVVRQVVYHTSKPYDDRFIVATERKSPGRRGSRRPVRRPLLSAAEILTSLQTQGLSPTEARRLVREARAAMTRRGWPAE